MINAGLHQIATVTVNDLYPAQLGSAIVVKIADDKGSDITLFMNDTSIKLLGGALATYAASRGALPVEPAPSYAETLFAAKPKNDYQEIPF